MKKQEKKAEAPKLAVKTGVVPMCVHEKARTPFTEGTIYPYQIKQNDLFSQLTSADEVQYEGWIAVPLPVGKALRLKSDGTIVQFGTQPRYNPRTRVVEFKPKPLDPELPDPKFSGTWALSLFSNANEDNEWGVVKITLRVDDKVHEFQMVVKNHTVENGGTILPLKRPYESTEQANEWNQKRHDREAAVVQLKQKVGVKLW